MNSILEIDPRDSGLGAAASIIGKLSQPSRMPIGLGSILGQAGGAYTEARDKATATRENLEMNKELRTQRAAEIAERIQAKQEAARKSQAFNASILKIQQSGQPLDEISILGAGLESGAFGPRETTEFMGKVMARKADREQKLEMYREKLSDQKIAREERESFQREMFTLQQKGREDMARLAAALRPQAQGQLVQDKDGNYIRIGPDNKPVPVMGPDGKPLQGAPKGAGGKLSEQEARGTLFMRQMDSAEKAAKDIVGEGFDLAKLGNQVETRMAGSDLTNWAASPKAQQYAQAAEQWSEAYLRLKTGAATNRDEIKRNARAFFPQPGDSSAVIKQKSDMRKKAVEDVSILAGRGANVEPPARGDDRPPWERP